MEVALEAVTDGLVQQDAGPARAQHHVHLARRAVDGLQIDQGLTQGFVHLGLPAFGGDPLFKARAAARAGRGAFTLAVLLDGDGDVQPDQRTQVAEQPPVAAQDVDGAALADQGGRNLHHARIAGAGPGVDLGQQGDLVREGRGQQRIDRIIEALVGGARRLGGGSVIAALGERSAVGGAADGGGGDFVGVGVAGGLARHHAQTEAFHGVVGGALQPSVVEDQGFAFGLFQEQLPVVGARQRGLQDRQGLVRGYARGVEDGGGGGDGAHGR
ncbi:hypothetical protein D3C73_853910 [compost metagenome]